MNFVDSDAFEPEKDPMPESYRTFRDEEGIPVVTGLSVNDLTAVDTARWHRTGQRGAFINLYGMEGFDDIQVHVIEPGGETSQQRHFYDEIVYVVEGSGVSVIGEGENETTFEWSENALFYLPHNVPYRHINTTSSTPVRLVAQTSLPQLLNIVDDVDFVFSCEHDFWSRFDGEEFFSAEGTSGRMYRGKYDGDDGPVTWEANFIPDVTKFDKLETWSRLGAMPIVVVPFPRTTMFAHLSDIPVGLYKKAHRHGPGANVFIRSGGPGYSLLWKPEWQERRIKVDWGTHSVFTPPAGWYHHHFNLSDEPAGQLAMHAPRSGTLHEHSVFDAHRESNIIDYPEEDPEVRAHYESELRARGLQSKMPQECYTTPNYEFEDL